MSVPQIWVKCLDHLQDKIPPEEFNIWIRSLQAVEEKEPSDTLRLLVPSNFVLDRIKQHYLKEISNCLAQACTGTSPEIKLEIGSLSSAQHSNMQEANNTTHTTQATQRAHNTSASMSAQTHSTPNKLNRDFTFDNFVSGTSNRLALASAIQVADNLGKAYNPLFIYGGVGLGKTHLMHAIGNLVAQRNRRNVLYLNAESFVRHMIRALQRNAMDEFKRYYRSVDLLLTDDVQFLAGKERSQEEYFHLFNALFEGGQQIIMTCDRYPKEISGLEERLRSRFGWGLTVAVEPPELETRVAILISKAQRYHIDLSDDVAFFIAKNIQSNVRELEGALKRVIATARFTHQNITVEFTREALRDLLTLQAKLINIENIQRTVAEYYKIKASDILSKRRNRSIARPRQMAMALAKELTNHSLPEIGDAFNGRDHTTVIHACRKIKELLISSVDMQEDWKNLLRILSA